MNSDVINRIIHIINPTANNSSNYIKQVPYREPSEKELEKISELVSEAITLTKSHKIEEAESVHKQINSYFEQIYAA